MRVLAKKRFFQDVGRIKSVEVVDAIEFIYDKANQVKNPNEIPGLKRLRQYKNFDRIEVAPYRIGVEIENSTIIFICVLPRSVFYEQFP